MKKDTVNLIKNLYESEKPMDGQQNLFLGRVLEQGEDIAKSIEDALTYDTFEFNCYECGKLCRVEMKKLIDFFSKEYEDKNELEHELLDNHVGYINGIYPPLCDKCADKGAYPKDFFMKN